MKLVQLNTSRQTSDKGEKREDSDEQELETIGGEPEWVFRQLDISTDGFGFNLGSGRSSQEGRNRFLLLTFEHGQAIIVNEFLGLWSLASFSGLLVVEARNRFGVQSGVDKYRYDVPSSCSPRDLSLSKPEVLCLCSN